MSITILVNWAVGVAYMKNLANCLAARDILSKRKNTIRRVSVAEEVWAV